MATMMTSTSPTNSATLKIMSSILDSRDGMIGEYTNKNNNPNDDEEHDDERRDCQDASHQQQYSDNERECLPDDDTKDKALQNNEAHANSSAAAKTNNNRSHLRQLPFTNATINNNNLGNHTFNSTQSNNNGTSNNIMNIMSQLDTNWHNPSWDILNQDSFGFNLLEGSMHGSLSFEVDGTGGEQQQGRISTNRERAHQKSIDLDITSAVTASLDLDHDIMSGLNMPHHHHDDDREFAIQESRNDVPELRDHSYPQEEEEEYDPFRYAFGDPNDDTVGGTIEEGDLPEENKKKASKSSGHSKKQRGKSVTKRGSTKTKAKDTKGGTTRGRKKKHKSSSVIVHEPLDGRDSPPALPNIESAPTSTLEYGMMGGGMMSGDIIEPSWSSSPNTFKKRGGRISSRGRKIKKKLPRDLDMPDVRTSSTWNGSAAAPFVPPLVSSSMQQPPREICITTKRSHPGYHHHGGGGGPMPPPPQYNMHMPPAYSYPPPPHHSNNTRNAAPQQSAPTTKTKPGKKRQPVASSPTIIAAVNGGRGQKGKSLLTLPDGSILTPDQAPGIGWCQAEAYRLNEIMMKHKSSNIDWHQLAKEHGMGRTARECHDRWTRYMKPGSRKGQWQEEEDAIVLRVIYASGGLGVVPDGKKPKKSAKHGGQDLSPFTQWADLAPQLPGRTGKQIRDRWVNYLNPSINHLPFSREDDLRLWAGHAELGKRWVEISSKIFHSTRSENHIKNRWYSAAFKKFIAKEYGIDAYVQAKQIQAAVPTHPGKKDVMPALGGSSSRGGGRTSKREYSNHMAV